MTAKQLEKSIQEIWELFRETGRKFEESRREFEESRREFEKRDEWLSQKVAAVGEQVAALTGKWGKFVEGLIAPAVERLFKARGIEVDKIYQRVRAHKNGAGLEVDIMAINRRDAVLIEAKSTLKTADIDEHLDRLARFKQFFPEYQDRRVFGAVAGIVIEEEADRYAYRNGLFVIAQGGETVTILNDEKFVPQVW